MPDEERPFQIPEAKERLWENDPEEEDRPEDALDALAISDPELLEAALQEVAHRAFVPHEGGQLDVMVSDARFRVVDAGRRWGKTKLAAHEVIKAASSKPNQVVWWVANTYRNVGRGYKEVVRQLPPSMLAKAAPAYTSNTLYLQLANGSVIEFYSGGSPDALAGEGVDFMVVDEGALMPDQVWNQMLRATLMDKGGRAMIISTPRGHNWFWKLYNLGRGDNPEYESWCFPQTANPYVPQSETDAVKEELPELVFRQEIMAEFLAAGASIFGTGLDREGTIVPGLAPPEGHLVMGIDLAKQNDFTVISACRAHDRLPCYRERFNQISWPVQRERIHEAYNYLLGLPGVKSVTVMLDSTGVGDVVYDDLVEEGLETIGIKFTNQWKEQAVKLLAADLEQGRAFVTQEQMDNGEFSSYAMTMTPAGNYKFEASAGHDDEVSAKLLEHWGVVHEGPVGIAMVIDASPRGGGETTMTTAAPEEELVADDTHTLLNRSGVWH